MKLPNISPYLFLLPLGVFWAAAWPMPFWGDDFIFLAAAQPGGGGMGMVVDWRLGFFRPLSQGALLGGLAALLPPSPALFHAIVTGLYVAAAMLLAAIVNRLSGSELLALATAWLWGTRSAHFLGLAWFAAAQEVLMVLFAFGALRVAVGELDKSGAPPSPRRIMGVAALTLAALLSKETAVVLPALVAAVLIAGGRPPRFAWRHPFVLASGGVAAVWLILRLSTSTLIEHARQSSGGLAGLGRNLVAYPLMFFDVNREMIRYFAEGGRIKDEIMIWVWLLAAGSVLVALGVMVGAAWRKGRQRQQGQDVSDGASGEAQRSQKVSPLALGALIWGMAGILPPLLHTQGFYGYYMMLANGGWCLLAALGWRVLYRQGGWRYRKRKPNQEGTWHTWFVWSVFGFALASVLIQTMIPGSLYRRAVALERGLERLKAEQPAPPSGAVILITDLDAASDADARVWRAMGWGAALPWLWRDGSLRVHSAFQPLEALPDESASSVYTLEIKSYFN